MKRNKPLSREDRKKVKRQMSFYHLGKHAGEEIEYIYKAIDDLFDHIANHAAHGHAITEALIKAKIITPSSWKQLLKRGKKTVRDRQKEYDRIFNPKKKKEK